MTARTVTGRALALLLGVAAPASAPAAERTIGIGNFDRLRIDGPFVVTVAAGPPRARVSGDDAALARTIVEVRDRTLVVRRGPAGWGERPDAGADAPVRVALSVPALAAVAVQAGARVEVTALAGAAAEVSLAGAGSISVAAAAADRLVATVIGRGTLSLAGRAGSARLVASDGGAIAARDLSAGDLSILTAGPGNVAARARYTARINHGGTGRVEVAGSPKCVVAGRGDAVRCGDAAPPLPDRPR